VGCLQINTSMRSLDFETRSRIAKECIARVCEAAGLRDPDDGRRPEPRIIKMLADQPDMSLTGADVSLSITSATLNLTVIDTGEVCLCYYICIITLLCV
jgi:SHC-transforming protein 1